MLGLNQHFQRRTLPQKLGRRGAGAIGPRAEYRDQIAHFGAREMALVGQPVERGTQAPDHARFLFGCRIEPAGDCHRIVAAHHRAEIARCGKLVVQSAVCDEKNFAVADLPIDYPGEPILTTQTIKSAFELPFPATIPRGVNLITGRSWSAAGTIQRVEVSFDGGTTYRRAVLKQGGNAVDAAIATSAAMGLLEPMSCGVGGDLFAIVWDAKTQKLYGLNANGAAPAKATLALFKDRGLDEIPEKGPLSWSVPGCVDGWDALRQKFGTKSFADLLAPSIRYAEDGAPVPEVIAGYWKSAAANRDAEFRQVYAPGGTAPRVGEVFKNPALGKTYRQLAEHGRDAFYTGDIARRLVAFSDRKGGLFSADDLAKHRSEWVEPVSTRYRGVDVWELPPPGQGIAVLQMLNLLEPTDLRALGPTSPDYWHLLIEAKKLAYADRAKFYADPRFARVPVLDLISKDYAAARRNNGRRS